METYSLEGVCETHVIPTPGVVEIGIRTAFLATISAGLVGPAGPASESQKASFEVLPCLTMNSAHLCTCGRPIVN